MYNCNRRSDSTARGSDRGGLRRSRRAATPRANTLVLAALIALLAAGALAATPKNPDKITQPTGPLKPTTEQLIDTATLAQHKTGTLLVLHTNDIHDIIKPPEGNPLGGMAYVAGYERQMRAQRPDLLALDAGDLLQKGDTLGLASKGEASYRALGAIGIDCTVPGNHDFAFGVDGFRRNIEAAGLTAICAGMVYEDTKKPVFQETLEKQIGSLRIGIIGGTANTNIPVDSGRRIIKFGQPELGQRVNELAREMEPRVDLTILLLHNGTQAGLALAKAAPNVDIVVCGHSNEVTEKPLKAETGALIVEVGRAGQWVGSLDLVVDRDQKRIGKYTFEMIPMDRTRVRPDEKLAAQIDAWEKQWCPEVQDAIAQAPKSLSGSAEGGMGDAGRWLGQAILAKTGADAVLFHREFFRNGLNAGPITSDDLYKMMQPRYAKTLVTLEATGAQLRELLELTLGERGEHIVGAQVKVDKSKPIGQRVVETNLSPERKYKVVVLATHIHPVAKHPYGITDLLKQLGIEWKETEQTILAAAVDYAKEQKTIVAPTDGAGKK